MAKFQKGHKINLGRKKSRDDLWNFRLFVNMVERKRRHRGYIDNYRNSEQGKKNRHLNVLKKILKNIDENFAKYYNVNTGNRLLNYNPIKTIKIPQQRNYYVPFPILNFRRFMERIDQIRDFVR